MGLKNSVPNKKASKTDKHADKRKAAVFSDDDDEFKKNFGMEEMLNLPKMPEVEVLPPVPVRVQSINQKRLGPSNSTSLIHNKVGMTKSTISTTSLPTTPTSSSHHGHKCDTYPLLIAQHRFIAKFDNEISLEEGDQVYLLNSKAGEWWYVETKSKKRGFVPCTHVKRGEVHAKWFVGNTPRILVENRVMQAHLPIGTFLIRENQSKKTLVLTIRESADSFKSYEIYRAQNDSGFYMTDIHSNIFITFISLPALVDYFSQHSIHICTKLTIPAPPLAENNNYMIMKKWQMDRRAIKFGKKLGEGQFGQVYHATVDNIPVAVKKMKDDFEGEESDQFLEEAKLLTKFDHQHLIRLLAVCTKEKPYYIVTEYMINDSLLKFLKAGIEKNKMNLESAMNISAQVASGMSYLSANKIIHRDLAARNVLVGEISPNHIPIVKVADFGLARKLKLEDDYYNMSHDTQLPVRWMAPEAYTNKSFSTKTDVWSYGILLWEIGTMGETPYHEWSIQNTMKKVAEGYKLPKPDLVPEFVYKDAFLHCIDMDPTKRPSFEQLFKYFDNDFRIAKIVR